MRLAESIHKTGETIEGLLEHLDARERTLRTVSLDELTVDPETATLNHGHESWEMTKHAAHQLASMLRVTPAFVLRVPNDLAAENLNTFLANAAGHRQIILENGVVAGFLKPGTIPVDPRTVIARLEEGTPDLPSSLLRRWDLTPEGAILRLSSPTISRAPKLNDVVEAGVDLLIRENTELTISARTVILRLICTNGAIATETKEMRKIGLNDSWKEPEARIVSTFQMAGEMMARALPTDLALLPKIELEVPEDPMELVSYLRSGLGAIDGAPIKSKKLVEAVADAMYSEDHTMWGLYNALTRLGRDSMDLTYKTLFERAGHYLSLNPQVVLEELEAAAPSGLS